MRWAPASWSIKENLLRNCENVFEKGRALEGAGHAASERNWALEVVKSATIK